jgi:uncharacterized protein involved in response to NO
MNKHYFFSQPHQPFFVLAFINAILSMFTFMLILKGFLPSQISATAYHAYSLIYMLFTPAFLAFLFTTFPRFSGTEIIPQQNYMTVFWILLGASVLYQVGIFFSSSLLIAAMILMFLGQLLAVKVLLNVYNSSVHDEKKDQEWILIGMAFGLFAHLLSILSIWLPTLHNFSIQISIYLYLFIVIFAVAQRMVPFFSHATVKKNKERFKVVIGLIALHVILETIQEGSSFFVDMILAYLIGKELWQWKLPFPNPNPLVWILLIALYWVPVSFALASITNFLSLMNGTNFLSLDIHALALGFFFTILIGFGTRVTLGHSGNLMKADRLTTILFYWTQLVVASRILTSLAVANSWGFIVFFDIALTVWMVMFGLWASRFFAVLIFGKKLESKE